MVHELETFTVKIEIVKVDRISIVMLTCVTHTSKSVDSRS